MKNLPQKVIIDFVNEDKLSVFTEFILRDIGMYVSKYFSMNYPILEWTYKRTPKSYVHVNQPLLIGFFDDSKEYPKPFRPELEPIQFEQLRATNLLRDIQPQDDGLYIACKRWSQWAPKNCS